MKKEIGNFEFSFVCEINPILDESGCLAEYFPPLDYKRRIHRYGKGPFCRFKIPGNLNKQGVYILVIDDVPVYVGECENLAKRWNAGYGIISPRNCYEGGQITNCRINNLIFNAKRSNSKVELWFKETTDRFKLESTLIEKIRPRWNKTKGKLTISKQVSDKSSKGPNSRQKNPMPRSSRYENLADFLKKKQNDITLSFEQIQKILGFQLPVSAYRHRAWWGNGGHNHASSWVGAGYKVAKVELGREITFRKISNFRQDSL